MSAYNAAVIVENNANTITQNRNEQIVQIVREFKNELEGTKDDFSRFHTTMRNLERLLLRNDVESKALSEALAHLTPAELTRFNDLYCLWETLLEKRFVGFLQKGVVKHYLDYPLFARFERLIDREVELLNGYIPKRMLFIGSGPMPITALCLRNRLGIQIDCLERFPEAIAEARIVMSQLGCENDINIIQGYGESFDVSEYDVILVALLAKPKRAILENILRTAKSDVKVICRTSDGSRSVFYEPTVAEAIPREFEVVKHARAGIDDTISSVLLKRIVE